MARSLDDRIIRDLSANCGRAYLAGARASGKPWRLSDELILSDAGLPSCLPPNNATVLQAPVDVAAMVEDVEVFFSASSGGGFQVWSLLPGVELSGFGYETSSAPCMCREPGGEPRRAPDELQLSEVTDDAGMRDVWAIVDAVFAEGTAREPLWNAKVLSDDYRVWSGSVDGRVVTTATASISDGFVGVYAVATLPEARGRGYAEAVTWAATLCRRDLPATLQASEEGFPLYRRMGFETVAKFTVWSGQRRTPDTRT